MPFSPERTKEIQSRIDARLQSGSASEWETSFLSNMAERFQLYGTKTRLSKAQYASLHKILKLAREQPDRTSSKKSNSSFTPAPTRSARPYQARPRPVSLPRAITAPRRAVRRAQRKIMVPLIVIVAFIAVIGSLFDSSSSRSPSNRPNVVSTPQPAGVTYAYVTGTRVNQRSGPSTSSSVMGVLTQGTRVEQLRDDGRWTQIRSALGTGWMSTSYLSGKSPAVVQPTPQGRSLRVSDVRVIDGDTVDIRGMTANVRLVGFNAPEKWRPSCTAERQVGERATARLSQQVRGATSIEFQRVPCSCQPGTEGTDRCNFGRFCGSLYVDGQDVGRILIAEGLAEPFRCGRTSCPPRPQPWCR